MNGGYEERPATWLVSLRGGDRILFEAESLEEVYRLISELGMPEDTEFCLLGIPR